MPYSGRLLQERMPLALSGRAYFAESCPQLILVHEIRLQTCTGVVKYPDIKREKYKRYA